MENVPLTSHKGHRCVSMSALLDHLVKQLVFRLSI